MTLRALADRPIPWLTAPRRITDGVVSTRARLARNLAGRVFPHRADAGSSAEVYEEIHAAARALPAGEPPESWELDVLGAWERTLLVERHLASRRHTKGKGQRGVLSYEADGLSLAINEEDHLRIQGVAAGFHPQEVLESVVAADRRLENGLRFAATPELGYLTACPTNVGTGLRLSVLVHLPGLALTAEIQRVHRSVGEMGMAVRGWHGEGSRALGDLWQLSNQRTLGFTEEEAVERLERVVARVVELEGVARERAVEEAGRRRRVEDRVHRSRAILESARMITAAHAMACASDVRLGKWMGYFPEVSWHTLNELTVRVQPAHLGAPREEMPDPEDAEWLRARWIRRAMQEDAAADGEPEEG